MNKQTEALRMAIEFMDLIEQYASNDELRVDNDRLNALMANAQQACKEALEQPAQEPYGWVYEECIDDPDHAIGYYYRHEFSFIEVKYGTPVYTHPAPSFVGLSDDEIEEIINNVRDDYYPWKDGMLFGRVARAIEQALKDKNHGDN